MTWLIERANAILGTERLLQLKKWYIYTVESPVVYVAFLVRRSYLLAIIMETITGIRMKDSDKKHYLTDASMLLKAGEIAEYYSITKKIPPILLCDDIMIHGRGINHFLRTLRIQIWNELQERNIACSTEELEEAIAKSIRVHVFAVSNGRQLLEERYLDKMHFGQFMEAFEWRELSHKISRLVIESGEANAVYSYSEKISQQEFEQIDRSGFLETEYMGIREYADIKYIYSDSRVIGINTVRFVQNPNDNSYRIIPFVFMPNLSYEETEDLAWGISDRLRQYDPEGNIQDYLLCLKGCNFIGEKRQSSLRSYNELLTLILSLPYLHRLNRLSVIKISKEKHRKEIIKLSRNYDLEGIEKTRDLLELIFKITRDMEAKNPSNWNFEKQIKKALFSDKGFSDEGLRQTRKPKKDFSSIRKSLSKELEDRIIGMAVDEEQSAISVQKGRFRYSEKRYDRRVVRSFDLLQLALENKTKWEAGNTIALFLQMMDAGVVAISSYAPYYLNVVGMSQFAKAGEQSLMIVPLRNAKYNLFLSFLYGNDYPGAVKMQIVINKLSTEIPNLLSEEEKDEVAKYLEYLEMVKQTPLDWCWDMFGNSPEEEQERIRADELVLKVLNLKEQTPQP